MKKWLYSSFSLLKWFLRVLLALILLLAILLSTGFAQKRLFPPPHPRPSITSADFVRRVDSSLVLHGSNFRFSGANLYWLGLLETGQSVGYPSYFEVEDALATAQAMGATVIRSHTLGISTGCPLCLEPGQGRFNQVAFQHVDFAIQAAEASHLKLIIPLVDNWRYYHGGKHTFTDWLGIPNEDMFYYDPTAIADFQLYVSALLNHVNVYTGVAYKDDPTILAWELGNELRAPLSWERTMADYIRGIDGNHLIASGSYNWQDRKMIFAHELLLPSIDIYTGHYYPPSLADLRAQATLAQSAQKVFIAEEYDWNTSSGNSLSSFLSAIEQSSIAGDLYWSLFPHNDTHGYIQQSEHFTLHYPGNTPDIQARVSMLRDHAYVMRGLPVPTEDIPDRPIITSIQQNKIFWRGVDGAYTYTIERSRRSRNGPWTILCDRCATDDDAPWTDTSRPPGQLWYRIRASTSSGVYGPYSYIYQLFT